MSQLLRDYLEPGGLQVLFAIRQQNNSDYFDIDLRWLSDYLIDQLPDDDKPCDCRSPMVDFWSIKKHINDLSSAGAIVVEKHCGVMCYIAPPRPELTIDPQEVSRRQSKRAEHALWERAYNARIAEAMAGEILR